METWKVVMRVMRMEDRVFNASGQEDAELTANSICQDMSKREEVLSATIVNTYKATDS